MLFANLQHRRMGCVFGSAITALILIGCGGESGNPRSGAEDASITWQWDLFNVGDTAMQNALSCDNVGAGNVFLASRNLDTGVTYTDTFLCVEYQGTTAKLPSGHYNLQPALYGPQSTNGNATTVLGWSSFDQVLVAGINTLGVRDFIVNSFVLGWTISASGAPASCAEVGGTGVELDVSFPSEFTGQANQETYTFPCADYQSTTRAIPYGPPPVSYPVQWQAYLLDVKSNRLTNGTPIQTFNVTSPNQADLGIVTFAL